MTAPARRRSAPEPGRRSASNRPSTGLVAVLAAVLLAGCAAKVDVPVPDPDPSTVAVCGAVMAALPDVVGTGTRREVTAPSLTAAWGDPPTTLRCGVPMPPTLTPTSACLEVDDVGWFAEEAGGGVLFTTVGRQVFVEVAVPDGERPPTDALVDLADAVGQHDPVVEPCV